MFKVTVYSADATGLAHTVPADELHDYLRKIGLNWKQSDQWHQDDVMIVVRPCSREDEAERLRGQLQQIAEIAA